MKFKTILVLSSLFILTIFSCKVPPPEAPAIDIDQVTSELQSMEDAFAAGLMAKDANAVVAYYAEDAVNLGNNEPMTKGKAAILEKMKNNMAKDTTSSTEAFKVLEVFASGDYAVEIGISTTTEEDGTVKTGKYMSLFEKRDGKYICIRDIWNNDAAPIIPKPPVEE